MSLLKACLSNLPTPSPQVTGKPGASSESRAECSPPISALRDVPPLHATQVVLHPKAQKKDPKFARVLTLAARVLDLKHKAV